MLLRKLYYGTKIIGGSGSYSMKKSNIMLVVIATFFTTIAQLSFKLGSTAEGFYIWTFSVNATIIFGFLSYCIAALLFIRALRGAELSILYPLWSLSFVWVFLASSLFLKESISAFNVAGLILIMLGVSFVGRGVKNA